MPSYKDRLLSAWGNDEIYEVGHPPPEIDQEIMKNAQIRPYGTAAPNPGKIRRNQVPQRSPGRTNGTSKEKTKSLLLDELSYYTNVKIIYGNFGIKDFDFQYVFALVQALYSPDISRLYNKTGYSGLEADIEYSYLNPLLQLFKYTVIIRNVALVHVAGKCVWPNCLLCEMGFLFDMLEKAEGVICRAENLLKTYGSLRTGEEDVARLICLPSLKRDSDGP